MHRFFSSRWAPVIAYALIVLAVIVYMNKRQTAQELGNYKDKVAACERGNALRKESNDRAIDHQITLNIQRDTLESGMNAAYANGDLATAEDFADNLRKLQGIGFAKENLIHCATAFKKP